MNKNTHKVIMIPTEKSHIHLDKNGYLLQSMGIYSKQNRSYGNDQHISIVSSEEKIIATTDDTLNVIKIPKEFISLYIEEYNKGNIIDLVNIDYETLGKYGRILLAKSPYNNEKNSDMSIYSDYMKITIESIGQTITTIVSK